MLSLEEIEHLQDKQLIKDFGDLKRCECLSLKEWDQFVEILNLREPPPDESEEQINKAVAG